MATCSICNKNITWEGKILLKDNIYICKKCWTNAGFNTWGDIFKATSFTVEDIRKMIERNNIHNNEILSFVVTTNISHYAKFNDKTRQMILSNVILVRDFGEEQLAHLQHPEHFTLFSYDQIVAFELLENGNSIASGGLGMALVGGALFGGAGAIVGASTRKFNNVCNELKIKLTIRNYKEPAFYIPLIDGETDKTKHFYKNQMKEAQNILSKLQLITSENANNKFEDNSVDKFEEIKKYKVLFDEGIITQEEFNSKKKELLNL